MAMTVQQLADLVLRSGAPDAEVELLVGAGQGFGIESGFIYDGVVILCRTERP